MIHFYSGPWQWITTQIVPYWGVPWSVGCLDFRNLTEQAQAGGTPGLGVFASDTPISDSNYDLLGIGNFHEIKVSQRLKDLLPKPRNYNLKGDDLIGLLLDLLTDAADPIGEDFVKPIIPQVDRKVCITIAGQTFYDRLDWGKKYTSKIKDVERENFKQIFVEVQAGKVPADHHQKVLDYLCEKYGIEDWKEFVPDDLQKDVPGRKPHDTTISENFNTADTGTLGPQLSWTELFGNTNVVTNAAQSVSIDATYGCVNRADSDLSSVDHYAQVVFLNVPASSSTGIIARKDSSATNTYYISRFSNFAGTNWDTYKLIAGTYTLIGSSTSAVAAANDVIKIECNGSSITRYKNGASQNVATDSAITTGTRCGLATYMAGTAIRQDDFQASDLAASGLVYTQLERSTRGYLRGSYVRW